MHCFIFPVSINRSEPKVSRVKSKTKFKYSLIKGSLQTQLVQVSQNNQELESKSYSNCVRSKW